MEKLTINTLEEFRDFCESEKVKEKAFNEEKNQNGTKWIYYHKAYRYFENYTNATNFNILDMLIDDKDFLSFPLEIEIIENPIMVEIVNGGFLQFFENIKEAFILANQAYLVYRDDDNNFDEEIEISGKGFFYNYSTNELIIELNKENKNFTSWIEK